MARRQRRKAASRSGTNIWLLVFQITILIGALMAVIAFRDGLSNNAGILVDSLSSEDIAVEARSSEDAAGLPTDQSDENTEKIDK